MTPSPYHNGKPCDLREFYANVKCHVYYQNAFQSHTYTVLSDPMHCSPPGSSVHEISQQEY